MDDNNLLSTSLCCSYYTDCVWPLKQVRPSSGMSVYPHIPRASIADRRQSPPLTASAQSVKGIGVYRQYCPILGFWEAKFPKMGDSLPSTPVNHRAKFDASSFIIVGEILNRTKKTNKENRKRSACVDNKQRHTSFTVHTVLTVVRKTTQSTQRKLDTTPQDETDYDICIVVTACHSTDAHTHDSNDCYSLRVLLLRIWDWWILNHIEIALRNAHFRYRGSIEYRDTVIVIVAPISGIQQHYPRPRLASWFHSFANGACNNQSGAQRAPNWF